MRKKPNPAQVLITRMPYAETYDPAPVLAGAALVDSRGLICVSVPIHVENPAGAIKLIDTFVNSGMVLVSLISWFRDRHIVVSKSRRLTNTYELLAVMSLSEDYVINKEAIRKLKRGFEGKENTFDEDEFLTCQGDHWPIRNDRRDRRFLPAVFVMNCAQLADLKPGDCVIDPYGNVGVKDTCAAVGWKYSDLGAPSNVRGLKKSFYEEDV